MDLRSFKKKIRDIPLRYILIFTIVNVFFLIYFGNILLRLAFFAVCLIILYFFGRLPFADVDPVPFTTGVLFLFFDFPIAAQYAIWTCPTADALTGNFNQWTFVTLGSILSSLFLLSLFSLSQSTFLIAFMVIYNLIRFFITALLGSINGAIISTTSNTLIYFIVINLAAPLISLGIAIFKKG